MEKSKKVGGVKRFFLEGAALIMTAFLFIIYMVPFALILLNSFKMKRDIITNPFSFYAKKGYRLENYIKAFE